jgi:hypothetical protein
LEERDCEREHVEAILRGSLTELGMKVEERE